MAYTNVATFSFHGIEDGNVVVQSQSSSTSDTWSELFTVFIDALYGAGYRPNRAGFDEVLDTMYGCNPKKSKKA